jgi:non-specific serine/threonine protein kinase
MDGGMRRRIRACARAACIDPGADAPARAGGAGGGHARRAAGAPRAGNPLDSCASAGFWARSMCIHQACQEDGIANHPVCVDERVRREAQERQRQLYGQ